MYAVAGVTGHTGKVVANTLLAHGKKVRVIVRDSAKGEPFKQKGAEVVVADLGDSQALAKALTGTEGAYLLVPPDPRSQEFIARGRRLVDSLVAAIQKAQVPHVVFLSSVAAHVDGPTGPVRTVHHAEKELAKVTGTRFTFLRAAYFMENTLGNLPPMKEQGMLPVFGGGEAHPFPMIASHDIGEIGAKALLEAPRANQVIELAGPQDYSLQDVAKAYSEVLGRTVAAKALPIEGMVPMFTSVGFSEDVAKLYREMTEAMGKGLFRFEGGKALATRGKITLQAFVKSALSAAG